MRGRDVLTTLLDLAGAACLVACGYFVAGYAGALGVAGVLFLAASWKASR